jgi:uracil phosphoribosyltransferase
MTARPEAPSSAVPSATASNVHVSSHPLLTTKLSLLRSAGTPSIVARSLTEYLPLIHEMHERNRRLTSCRREIATILAYEATKDAFTIKELGEVRLLSLFSRPD